MRNRLIFAWLLSMLFAGCARSGSDSKVEAPNPTTQTKPKPVAPLFNAGDAQRIDDAIRQGNMSELSAMLQNNPALLETVTDHQETPLHLAAEFGTVDAVKWLLDHGAKANTRAYNDYTPLHVVKDGKIATLLIQAGADLNAIDVWGNSPLQTAAEEEKTEVVDAILAIGYKIDRRSAIQLKKWDAVKNILKQDPGAAARPSHTFGLQGGKTPLALAAGQKDLEIVQLLLDAGADVNEGTDTPNEGGPATALTNAVWAGDPKVVQLLLSHGASTHVTGGAFFSAILDYAKNKSSPDIVSMLEVAEKKANPTTQAKSATTAPLFSVEDAQRIDDAVRQGNIAELDAMLQKNPALLEGVTDLKETPLHLAAAFGTADAVQWLLDHGAKVNTRAVNDYTPLHLVKDGKIAKLLIGAGADLSAIDVWGNSPLQKAAEEEKTEVVDVILATGYKMDLRSAIQLKKRDTAKQILKQDPGAATRPSHASGLWGGETPLALATGQRDFEIVQLLLDAGADVNEGTDMPNAGGTATALTNAVWAGDPKIVKLLLSHGASTHVTGGKFFNTILDYALGNSSPEIVLMLEAADKDGK